jgi:hypothetical protein
MVEHISPLEARLTMLEARVTQQEAEIGRLRGLLARSGRRSWLLALAGVVGLLLASATWLAPAAAQDGKGGEGTVALAGTGTGQPVSLGQANAATLVSDFTSIYDPSGTTLMPLAFRIANYATDDIGLSYRTGFRTALVGSTSGSDTSTGTVTRVGVMGLVDQGGYGVYGASTGGIGITGISDTGIGGEFSGGQAQLRLVPGPNAGPPSGTSHLAGELYLDSQGNLYLCNVGGATPRWSKLNSLTVYLPLVK